MAEELFFCTRVVGSPPEPAWRTLLGCKAAEVNLGLAGDLVKRYRFSWQGYRPIVAAIQEGEAGGSFELWSLRPA